MKNGLISDGFKITSIKFITTFLTLFSAMILSRSLTLIEYGTYSQLMLAINLITTIIILGLPNSINFFIADIEKAESNKFLSTYFSLALILSVLSGIILMATNSLMIIYFRNSLLSEFTLFLFLFPLTKIISTSFDHVLIVYKKTNQMMILKLVHTLFILTPLSLSFLSKITFTQYIYTFMTFEILYSFIVYLVYNKIIGKFKFVIDYKLVRDIFRFSIPIGLASVLGIISNQLDKLIIGRFYNTAELAIYANAAKELPIAIIASSITAVLLPRIIKIFKQDKKRAIQLWSNVSLLTFAIMAFFSLTLIAFSDEVITLLYSEKYIPGKTVFQIYSLVLIFRFTYFGMILNAAGKTKFVFYSSLLSLVLNVILNFILFYTIGFNGPAIATVISLALIAFLQIIASSKVSSVPFTMIFRWKNMTELLVFNVIAMGGVLYLKTIVSFSYNTNYYIFLLIIFALWSFIYLLYFYYRFKNTIGKLLLEE